MSASPSDKESLDVKGPPGLLWLSFGVAIWLAILGTHTFGDYFVYQLSRWGVCGIAILLGWKFHRLGSVASPPFFAILAVLYNPFQPISFDDAWPLVNRATALLLLGWMCIVKRHWGRWLWGLIHDSESWLIVFALIALVVAAYGFIWLHSGSAHFERRAKRSGAASKLNPPQVRDYSSPIPVNPPPGKAQLDRFGWTVVHFGGVACVPLADVAAYYKFTISKNVGDKNLPLPTTTALLESSAFRLEFTHGMKDLLANSVRLSMFHGVFKRGEDWFISLTDVTLILQQILGASSLKNPTKCDSVVLDIRESERNYGKEFLAAFTQSLKSENTKVMLLDRMAGESLSTLGGKIREQGKDAVVIVVNLTQPDESTQWPTETRICDLKTETYLASDLRWLSIPLAAAIQSELDDQLKTPGRGLAETEDLLLSAAKLPAVFVKVQSPNSLTADKAGKAVAAGLVKFQKAMRASIEKELQREKAGQ